MSDATNKPIANVPALTASGLKGAISSAIRAVLDGSMDTARAQALAKLAAQHNAVMRTELDAVRLASELASEVGGVLGPKMRDNVMKAVGHSIAEEEK